MRKLNRPIQVTKAQRNYLSNEQFQDYAEQQFSSIFNYISFDVLFDDENNTKTTLNFDVDLRAYSAIEFFYQTPREGYLIKGSQTIISPVGSCLNIVTYLRKGTNKQYGTTSLYSIGQNTIALEAGSSFEFTSGSNPILNTVNSTYITGIKGYK